MKTNTVIYRKYHSRLKSNLRKKKTLKGMFFTRLIAILAVFIIAALVVVDKGYFADEGFLWNRLADNYNSYADKLQAAAGNYDSYMEGGYNRLEISEMSEDEQFVASLGRVIIVPSMIANGMDGYWGIYDYDKKEFIAGQSETDNVYVPIQYRKDSEVVTLNYRIADEQRDMFLSLCGEGAIGNEAFYVTSGLLIGDRIYVETYELVDGSKKTVDLSNVSLVGARHIFCEISPDNNHKWSHDNNVRYGVDGQYEIATGACWKALGSYNSELKEAAAGMFENDEFESGPINEGAYVRRYWITSYSGENSKLATVLTYTVTLEAGELQAFLIKVIGITLGLALLVSIIWTAISYTRYKVQYDTYAYRSMLTDMLAHDLKTPLTVISGCAESINESNDLEKTKGYSNKISENVEYMNNMISNILTMSEKENLVIDKKSNLDVSATIKKLIEESDALLQEKKLKTKINGSANMEVDEVSFTILLRNILDNAIKYAPEGDTIDINLSNKELSVTNALSYEITVDNEKLFEAFVKGNKARTGRNGNGIGLAIVKSIADAHGIKCCISTDNNKFSIKLLQ